MYFVTSTVPKYIFHQILKLVIWQKVSRLGADIVRKGFVMLQFQVQPESIIIQIHVLMIRSTNWNLIRIFKYKVTLYVSRFNYLLSIKQIFTRNTHVLIMTFLKKVFHSFFNNYWTKERNLLFSEGKSFIAPNNYVPGVWLGSVRLDKVDIKVLVF